MQPTYYMGSAKKSNYARLMLSDAPSNPDDLNSYMDNAISNLKSAYLQGGIKIALNPDNLANYVTGNFMDNTALDAVEKNYSAVGGFINQLDTSLRQAVLAGQNASGGAYDITRWQSFANDVASDIKDQTGYAWDSSVIATAPSSAYLAAGATAKVITNPSLWPWWLWLVAAGGALIVLNPILTMAAKLMKSKETA